MKDMYGVNSDQKRRMRQEERKRQYAAELQAQIADQRAEGATVRPRDRQAEQKAEPPETGIYDMRDGRHDYRGGPGQWDMRLGANLRRTSPSRRQSSSSAAAATTGRASPNREREDDGVGPARASPIPYNDGGYDGERTWPIAYLTTTATRGCRRHGRRATPAGRRTRRQLPGRNARRLRGKKPSTRRLCSSRFARRLSERNARSGRRLNERPARRLRRRVISDSESRGGGRAPARGDGGNLATDLRHMRQDNEERAMAPVPGSHALNQHGNNGRNGRMTGQGDVYGPQGDVYGPNDGAPGDYPGIISRNTLRLARRTRARGPERQRP